jgi:hypothetical protein
MAIKPSLRMAGLWCCRLLLAGTFAYAGTVKLLEPQAFAVDIAHYRLLPHLLTVAVAVYLPWIEIFCAASVLSRWRDRGALLLLGSLCVLFCAAIASAWIRGLDIHCGCFGNSGPSSSLPVAFFRSLGLGFVALLCWMASARCSQREVPPPGL